MFELTRVDKGMKTGTHPCSYAKHWYHWLILCKLKYAGLASSNFSALPSDFICTATQSGVSKIVHCSIISNSKRKKNPCVNPGVNQEETNYMSYSVIM